MFRILRYFTIFSVIAFTIATLVMVWFYRNTLNDELMTIAENNNVTLTRAFANSVWPDFATSLTQFRNSESKDLRALPKVQQLHDAVRGQMHGTNIVKLQIHDLGGRTLYSTQVDQIGLDNSKSEHFQAAKTGLVTSEFAHHDSMDTMHGTVSGMGSLTSFVPVFNSADPTKLEVVFEVYADITDLTHQMSAGSRKVMFGVIGILALLFLALYAIVKRADSTIRLQHRELKQAKFEAENAASTKSQFLANMSHEIRTPLNGVLGMTELLLNTPLNSQQRRFTETVYQSGDLLLNTINDILDFSKIEAGKFELEYIEFDMRKVIEDLGAMFAERAQRKGLEIICVVPPDMPPMCHGDVGRMRQVLTNLIGNAVKFTETGEVVVRTLPLDISDDQIQLRVEVEDTGIGISPGAIDTIFRPFTQADGSVTRQFGGTGLGLAIASQIVALMGGQLQVESNAGKGSRFWFDVTLDATTRDGYEDMNPPMDFADVRALVVDDNATNREILFHQLGAWGIANEGVSNGPDALKILSQAIADGQPFHLVVLDMQMPGMDGLRLAQAIKANPELSNMRMLMLSSVFHSGDTEARRSAGIRYNLTKPVRQSELYNCITNLLGRPGETLSEITGNFIVSTTVDDSADALFDQDYIYNVLLAEDNPVNQQVALAMLQQLACDVKVVGDGEQAVEAFNLNKYDAILMDCQMPGVDGYAATAQIRRIERSEGRPIPIPIIALTANALEGDRERCLSAGMDDYVSKPFSKNQLHEMLARWIPGRSTQTSADTLNASEK